MTAAIIRAVERMGPEEIAGFRWGAVRFGQPQAVREAVARRVAELGRAGTPVAEWPGASEA